MTEHTSYTPTSSTSAVARVRNASGTYASRAGAQTLTRTALDAIRQLAQLDSDSPAAMLAVLDDLREIVQHEVDADLVEVSPGAFLPSSEARQLDERRQREALCDRCVMELSIDERDGDEHIDWDAVEQSLQSTPHTCHDDELHAFVESRSELSSKIVVAHRRSSDDACERLTIGCCVDHTATGFETNCETW